MVTKIVQFPEQHLLAYNNSIQNPTSMLTGYIAILQHHLLKKVGIKLNFTFFSKCMLLQTYHLCICFKKTL